jgi:prolyl oligopeptidase
MQKSESDRFTCLEQDSKATADWVRAQNERTRQLLNDDQIEADRQILLDIFNSEDRLPSIMQYGEYVYNCWTNEENPRGLWRRSTLLSFQSDCPIWESLIDLDALCADERESWVWRNALHLRDHSTVLVGMSRDGADTAVIREFDLISKCFIKDGFHVEEGNTAIDWIDPDTVLVATTGASGCTSSGYPRIVKRWTRGTPLSMAPQVFEVGLDDFGATFCVSREVGREHLRFLRLLGYFRSETIYEKPDGSRQFLNLPLDCDTEISYGRIAIRLRSDWTDGYHKWVGGSLIVCDFSLFLEGKKSFQSIFQPSPGISLLSWISFSRHIVLTTLENVQTRIYVAEASNKWTKERVRGLPETSTVSGAKLSPNNCESNALLIGCNDFLQPHSVYLLNVGGTAKLLKKEPARFDATGMTIRQYNATADDGTPIPYFFVAPRASCPIEGWPVQLTGYGGFEVSLLPNYDPIIGTLWLARGGAYALANIRGGGEFGPEWHRAGTRERRITAQDDFAAVASDIVKRRLSRPDRIIGTGASNGGLLVANMLVRHPKRFGAFICTFPLLDMKRYTKLSGNSYIEEYGDPDNPEDWAFLKNISAYHLIAPNQTYPPVLLMTTASDDRVHPGHARKMSAQLQEMGYQAMYYELDKGGHTAGADNIDRALFLALQFSFRRRWLKTVVGLIDSSPA